MNNKDIQIIEHIRDYCGDIAETINRFGDTYEAFVNDKDYYNSVSMCIMQIGELSAKLGEDFKDGTRESVPWGLVKSMRNHFAHSYSDMDSETIWETLKEDIPVLKKHCDEWIEGCKNAQ